MDDDDITWFWIGSHADYDNLLKRLRNAEKDYKLFRKKSALLKCFLHHSNFFLLMPKIFGGKRVNH